MQWGRGSGSMCSGPTTGSTAPRDTPLRRRNKSRLAAFSPWSVCVWLSVQENLKLEFLEIQQFPRSAGLLGVCHLGRWCFGLKLRLCLFPYDVIVHERLWEGLLEHLHFAAWSYVAREYGFVRFLLLLASIEHYVTVNNNPRI